MKKLAAILVGLLLALVVSGLPAAPEGDAAAGKTVYTRKCAACHAPDGAAKASIAKMMKVEMKHLGSKEVQGKKDDELAKDVTKGTGKMKGVSGLSDADVANLVAYMRTLKQK